MDPETGKIHNPLLFLFQLLWVGFKLLLIPFLFFPVLIYLQFQEWLNRIRRRREVVQKPS
jgi:hypothetical protein